MYMPRIDIMMFPDGKSKALTFSYDDGVIQDRKLVSLFNTYGVKGTFNIGSGLLDYQDTASFTGKSVDISKVKTEEFKALYEGHEIAGHGLTHASLVNIGTPAAMYEIIEDKKRLEALNGDSVRGFAYPFGMFNSDVKKMLELAGYEYARVVPSSGNFEFPEDFREWKATCHHNDEKLMEFAAKFCGEAKGPFRRPELFYVWGHAYEFDMQDNWSVMEDFLKYVSPFKDKIWFATNIEICDYINAFRGLQYSADKMLIRNPSSVAVWIDVDKKTHKIEAGATLHV